MVEVVCSAPEPFSQSGFTSTLVYTAMSLGSRAVSRVVLGAAHPLDPWPNSGMESYHGRVLRDGRVRFFLLSSTFQFCPSFSKTAARKLLLPAFVRPKRYFVAFCRHDTVMVPNCTRVGVG